MTQAKTRSRTVARASDPLPAEALDAVVGGTGLFEILDYSFDIEQVLNIGSQSSGAGAGKMTFKK